MSVSEAAKSHYAAELREQLERDHFGQYVAIEPQSKSHFLGETFMDAALAAKDAHPTATSFVLRIGHEAAVHIGAASL